MIVETIVSTMDASGRVNAAPMGIALEGETILLRPFRESLTHRNLRETGEGVVNVTDNVLLFARSALDSWVPPHRPATKVRGVILEDVCHWREFRVEASDLSEDRGRFWARVVAHGRGRDFLGFNRAKHAVIEATILATRLHLLGRETVFREIERLRPMITKTAGPEEEQAFELIHDRVRAGAADAH